MWGLLQCSVCGDHGGTAHWLKTKRDNNWERCGSSRETSIEGGEEERKEVEPLSCCSPMDRHFLWWYLSPLPVCCSPRRLVSRGNHICKEECDCRLHLCCSLCLFSILLYVMSMSYWDLYLDLKSFFFITNFHLCMIFTLKFNIFK